jgi:hypothetical protein
LDTEIEEGAEIAELRSVCGPRESMRVLAKERRMRSVISPRIIPIYRSLPLLRDLKRLRALRVPSVGRI